jgi:hypothetical protein
MILPSRDTRQEHFVDHNSSADSDRTRSSRVSQFPNHYDHPHHCFKQPHHHDPHDDDDLYLPPGMIVTTHNNTIGINNNKNNVNPKHNNDSTNLTRKRMYSISFSLTTRIRKVLHINNYSESERQACWYNEQEKNESKKERKRHIKIALLLLQQQQQHHHQQQEHLPDGVGRQIQGTMSLLSSSSDHKNHTDDTSLDCYEERGLEQYLDCCYQQPFLSPKERFRSTVAKVRRIVVEAQRSVQQQKRHQRPVGEDHSSDGSYDDEDDDEDSLTMGDNWMERSFQIAQLYKEACYESKVAAYLRGIQDARVAKELASIW